MKKQDKLIQIEQYKFQKQHLEFEYQQISNSWLTLLIFLATISISTALILNNIWLILFDGIIYLMIILSSYLLYFRNKLCEKNKQIDSLKKMINELYNSIIKK